MKKAAGAFHRISEVLKLEHNHFNLCEIDLNYHKITLPIRWVTIFVRYVCVWTKYPNYSKAKVPSEGCPDTLNNSLNNVQRLTSHCHLEVRDEHFNKKTRTVCTQKLSMGKVFKWKWWPLSIPFLLLTMYELSKRIFLIEKFNWFWLIFVELGM